MRQSARRFKTGNILLLVLFHLFAVVVTSALSPDPRLLPLVPPGSQIVAGMRAPSLQGQPDSFLLITRNNSIDLRDFFALTGADQSRLIHQVIFVAAPDPGGLLREHSLLVSGHFDQGRIFRSADGSNARTGEYRGIAVLVVQPFERERGAFNDLRWLALIDSNVAIFGTVTSVQQELDRHLASSPPDPSVVQKLARLRRDDDTWCLVAAPLPGGEIQNALRMLDPELVNLSENDAFQFGIRYGRHVEFEYEVTASSRSSAQAIASSLTQSLAGPNAKESSFLPRSSIAGVGDLLHGVVKVSRPRYEEWLTEVSARSRTRIAAPSHGSTENSAGFCCEVWK